ncbi:MAG TPA: sulfotransferase family 2 domain-containing protein [Pedococcus sp.]
MTVPPETSAPTPTPAARPTTGPTTGPAAGPAAVVASPEPPEFAAWVRRYNGLAFLHPQWRLLFVSVPKAAGTSLNVALTRSAGIEFPGRFVESLGEESLVSQTIWDGGAGGRPMVESLDDAAFDALMREGLRTVFTVVRHPVERLLTTWSSKYLVRAPYYRTNLGLPGPGLRRFDSVDEVLADLDALVAHLHADPELVHRDVHLVPQHMLLRGDLSRFDHVGRTDRLGETIDWLRERLATEGVDLAPVGHDNDSPVDIDPSMVDPLTLRRIHELYAGDYDFLGFDPGTTTLAGTLDAAVLPTLNREIEHNVRAEVLHRAATERRSTRAAARQVREGITRRLRAPRG